MAAYKYPIVIQKLQKDEIWIDYYYTHAQINKVSGKEVFQASTNISNTSYDFKVRYCEKIKDIIFHTSDYRILYNNCIFDIKNVDQYAENKNNVTITGEFYGEISID